MGPFLRKVTTPSGATAVQIVAKEGRSNRILEHLGSAHSPAELAALMEAGRQRLHPDQGELDVFGETPDPRGTIEAKRSRTLWTALTSSYRALGLDSLEDRAFEQLVLARIVEPTSKADSIRVIDELGIVPVSLRSMFRCLERIESDGYRDQVSTLCFQHCLTGGDVSLVLYDVTTLYFEAEKEDDLRKVGYSKERRVDPQVVVGLLVDRTGFPLEIGCFEGNKAETHTLIPMIRQFQDRHDLTDMVVVADAGMMSSSNLKALDDAGFKFIVGARQTRAPGDLANHFHWHGDAFTDGQLIDTITPRSSGQRQVPRATRAEPVWKPEVHEKSWRAVWRYSAKRAHRDQKTLAVQEARARDIAAGVKHSKSTRFIKTSSKGQVVDEAALKRANSLIGLKGYLTNIPAGLMPAGEVIASYHDLWHVEQSFRMSKTDLDARPMFHHRREAIEAHLTIVFTALAVSRYMQQQTGLSIKKIVKKLRPLLEITLTIAGHPYTASDPIDDEAQAILKALSANPN